MPGERPKVENRRSALTTCLLFLAITDCSCYERECGEKEAGEDGAVPAPECPEGAGKECAQGAADKVDGHEDGVHAAGGFGAEFHDGALIAQLDKLHADVDEDDAHDDGGVAVASEVEGGPGGGHEEVPCVAEFFYAEALDILADAGCGQGAGDSAESQKPNGFTVLEEGCLLHAEGEACPQRQKGAEGESRADAVDSCLGESHKKFPDGFQHAEKCAAVSGGHVGQNFKDDGGGDEHHHGCNEEHGSPAKPFAHKAAAHAGGENSCKEAA